MKVYESVVSKRVLNNFSTIMGKSLMNHAFNTTSVESYLAVAGVLWPEVVIEKNYVFIAEFYNGNIESLEQQYDFDRKSIEMHVNSWAIGDFFLLARDESLDNDLIFNEFCKVLKFFWELRFKELFPDKNFKVEIKDSIMGEEGETITVYQED